MSTGICRVGWMARHRLWGWEWGPRKLVAWLPLWTGDGRDYTLPGKDVTSVAGQPGFKARLV